MKRISLAIACLSICFIGSELLANPGVIIDAKGKVTVDQKGSSSPAKTGMQFADGATIVVGAGSSATIMLNNGAVKKLASGERYTAAKTAAGESAGKPLIKGLAMAYNDAAAPSRGPTVHAMVKEAVPGKMPSGGDKQMDPSRTSEMKKDLNQINSLGLDKDGKALMQAQVYYKYGQNQKVVDTLLPVYSAQNPPADMVKNLLFLGYQKMGKPEEAEKYK